MVNPKKCIQHNLAVADGVEGFGALLQHLPPNSAKVKTVRVVQDGDVVSSVGKERFVFIIRINPMQIVTTC